MKEKGTQVQETQSVPNKLDPKCLTLRHIIIKMTRLKDKERNLKALREKQVVTYKGAPIRLSSDYSTESFQARREWCEIFKVMKSKDLQTRLIYPAKLSFKIEGEIRSFPDKKILKEVFNTKPVVQKENVKGLALGRRKRERKNIEENSLTIKWHYIRIYQ